MAEIIIIELEKYHDTAKRLPIPDNVLSCGSEDENGGGRECVLFYDELKVCLLEAA